jgi:hypothetical protein
MLHWLAGTLSLMLSWQGIALPQPPPGNPNPAQGANAAAATPGTATVRGHVLAADTGQPLRKAQVRMTSPENRENRLATTDTNGAYEFKEVRGGRYQIAASKGSYVGMSYGQDRPTDAPKPLQILDGQTVERLDFVLPRGAIITGRILDEFGEPAPEIAVTVERYQFIQGQRRLVPTGRQTSSNDLGEFRLFGIPPGQYYLAARWRNQSAPNANTSDRTGYPPTFFPGTSNAAEAQRIALGAGQQVDEVVLMLRPIRAARITGTALFSDGKPMSPAMIMVVQTGGFGFSMGGGGPVRPDGTFTLNGITPGEYLLRVQTMGPLTPDNESATVKLTVAGTDISDLALVGTKPVSGTGRIVVDPAAAQNLPRNLMVSAFPIELGFAVPPPPPARVADDGSFELKAIPGLMRLDVRGGGPGGGMASGWAVRSVRLNGADVTDSGVAFKANEPISGLEIELTNKVTSITGLVATTRGEPSKDYTAIVFSQEKEKWTPPTRYQGSARPDQDGRFKITGLPPGEYYIVAVDRLEPGQSGDPEFLERMRVRATPFSLNEGETRTMDLRLQSGT